MTFRVPFSLALSTMARISSFVFIFPLERGTEQNCQL